MGPFGQCLHVVHSCRGLDTLYSSNGRERVTSVSVSEFVRIESGASIRHCARLHCIDMFTRKCAQSYFSFFMVPDRNWYCKSIARDLLCHCTGCRECGSACTDSLPAEQNYLTGEGNCFHSCELLHARYHLHMQVLLQRLGSSWLKLVGPPPHITIYFRGRWKDFQGGESRLTKKRYPHLE